MTATTRSPNPLSTQNCTLLTQPWEESHLFSLFNLLSSPSSVLLKSVHFAKRLRSCFRCLWATLASHQQPYLSEAAASFFTSQIYRTANTRHCERVLSPERLLTAQKHYSPTNAAESLWRTPTLLFQASTKINTLVLYISRGNSYSTDAVLTVLRLLGDDTTSAIWMTHRLVIQQRINNLLASKFCTLDIPNKSSANLVPTSRYVRQVDSGWCS